MADVFTKKKRSWVMSRIRSKNTKMENLLAEELKKAKIKFKRYPKIYGNPDFLINKNIVVFVDGCFWHKCPIHYKEPKIRKKFWIPKIRQNVKRDEKVNKKLKEEGYKVIRFWEHEIEKNIGKCIKRIQNNINNKRF